jgi:hypothetical protein
MPIQLFLGLLLSPPVDTIENVFNINDVNHELDLIGCSGSERQKWSEVHGSFFRPEALGTTFVHVRSNGDLGKDQFVQQHLHELGHESVLHLAGGHIQFCSVLPPADPSQHASQPLLAAVAKHAEIDDVRSACPGMLFWRQGRTLETLAWCQLHETVDDFKDNPPGCKEAGDVWRGSAVVVVKGFDNCLQAAFAGNATFVNQLQFPITVRRTPYNLVQPGEKVGEEWDLAVDQRFTTESKRGGGFTVYKQRTGELLDELWVSRFGEHSIK